MATAVRPSHTRDPSITRLECDVNPNFTFPAQPRRLPLSSSPADPKFPPLSGGLPARRRSEPSDGSESQGPTDSQPRPRSSDALKSVLQTVSAFPSPVTPASSHGRIGAPPTPYYLNGRGSRTVGQGVAPTVLNASVTLGPVPNKDAKHASNGSELLAVPALDPQSDQQTPLPSPQKALPSGPPPSASAHPRRGHAHRRSGAISSGDVWALMNNSAPQLSTPTNVNVITPPPPSVGQSSTPQHSPVLSWSAPVSPGAQDAPSPTQPGDENASDSSTVAKRRVSFIDSVEIIPRPLSAGTETSSMTTVRAHSATGSIASVASLASPTMNIDPVIRTPSPTPSPTPRRNRTRSNSQTMEQPTAALRATSDRSPSPDRPSTAGAILNSPTLQLPNGASSSLKRPATASPTLTESAATSPVKQSSRRSHKKAQSDFSGFSGKSKFNEATEATTAESSPKKKKKRSKKGKKGKKHIKDWAGTILGRGKGRHSKRGMSIPHKRTPTPDNMPMSRSASPPAVEPQWFAASWNESYVIMPVETSPVFDNVSVSPPQGSPVIDLDAALGPFKTPVGPNAGFAAARRRRMHSAGGRGAGHRRSESMPEMQLFSLEEDEPMDDLYEEDEEEESDSSSSGSDSEGDDESMTGTDGLGIGINAEHTTAPDSARQRSNSADSKSLLSIPESPRGTRSISPSRRPADIVTSNSAAPSATAPTAAGNRLSMLSTATLDSPLTFVTANSNLNTPVQPDFSEDAESSHFDIYSDYLGEPGPEMRPSADDIPSLTSSSSTMTMSGAYSGMPSTPGTGDMIPVGSTKEKKSRRWSRVWGFWKQK